MFQGDEQRSGWPRPEAMDGSSGSSRRRRLRISHHRNTSGTSSFRDVQGLPSHKLRISDLRGPLCTRYITAGRDGFVKVPCLLNSFNQVHSVWRIKQGLVLEGSPLDVLTPLV